MALKAMLFLLPVLLLVTTTTRVSCNDDQDILTEHSYAKVPVKAPAHAPEKAHAHAPVKAPAHAHPPRKAHAHPPQKAHAHPPVEAPPAHSTIRPGAPTPILPPLEHGCTPLCEERCKTHRKKRPCMKVCTACCDKCKCVPPGTSGNEEKCYKWDYVTLHGQSFKCP